MVTLRRYFELFITFVRNHLAKFRNYEEICVYYLMSLTVFIDFINGAWLNLVPNSDLTIGQTVRFFILFLFLFYIIKYNFKTLKVIGLISLFFLLNIILSYIVHREYMGLIVDVKMFTKIVYFAVIAYALYILYVNNRISKNIINKVINNNLYMLPLLFALSYVIGIGNSSYGDAGLKGAFFSLNGITAVCITLLIFAFDKLYIGQNKKKGIILVIYIIVPLILLGTKSSFLFIFFIVGLYLVFNLNDKKNTKKFLKFVGIALGSFVVIILLFFRTSFVSIIQRQIYFIRYHNDILTYLLSGRNDLLRQEWSNFFEHLSLRRIFIGNGFYASQRELAISMGNVSFYRGVEMDIFDIFFWYGIIGVLLSYGSIVIVFLKAPFRRNFMSKQPFVIALICLLIFSILGGHVFGEALTSTFLGIIIAGLSIANIETREDKR